MVFMFDPPLLYAGFPLNVLAVGDYTYRIYSINRPGLLVELLDPESGRLFEASW